MIRAFFYAVACYLLERCKGEHHRFAAGIARYEFRNARKYSNWIALH